MIGNREEHYTGKATDLSALGSHIEEYLHNDGFGVQVSAPSTQGTVIQANKGGFLAGLVAADRALTITITGSPDDFTIRIGIGKWLEHLATLGFKSLWPRRPGTSRSRTSWARPLRRSWAEWPPEILNESL